MENHGNFFAGDRTDEVEGLVAQVMNILKENVKRHPCLEAVSLNLDKVMEMASEFSVLYGSGGEVCREPRDFGL